MALSFSASSSDAGQVADALRRQNSAFRAQIAGAALELRDSGRGRGARPGHARAGLVHATSSDLAGRRRTGRRAAAQRRDRRRHRIARRPPRRVPVEPASSAPVAPVDPAATTDPAADDRDRRLATADRPPRRRSETAAPPVETAAPPATAGSGGGRRRSVNLIDRRVGLLFAAFVVLPRARRWSAPSGSRGSAAARSAPRPRASRWRRSRCPGSRGTIYDRTGRELAVSEDAATVFATPVPGRGPRGDRAQARQGPRPRLRGGAREPRRPRVGLRLHRPQGRPRRRRADPRARPARDRDAPRQPPDLPAGRARRPGDRHGRDRQPGPDRARGVRGRAPARHRRRARGDPRRARRRARARHDRRRRRRAPTSS